MTGLSGIALASLIFALGGISARDRALLRGASSPRAIEIPSSGAAVVILSSGKRVAVRAMGGVGVTRHWVALAAGLPGRSILVTAGMLGAPGARLLRLWALWGRTPGVAAGQRQA